MERLIVAKCLNIFQDSVSDRQYGFLIGKSTIDDMCWIRESFEHLGLSTTWVCFWVLLILLIGCGGWG